MDISNRALAMFLLAAIVVSLAGTITSLNKLGAITTTGYASTDTGTVILDIEGSLSIVADNASIDFGACTPYPSGPVVINSENGSNTSGANGICTYGPIQNITIRNDGTVDANVTIQSDVVGDASGGTFLASAAGNSEIAYKAENHSGVTSSTGGCSASQPNIFTQYTNLTTAAQEEPLCDNLTWGADTANSLTVDFEIIIPENVPIETDATATITFTANTIA